MRYITEQELQVENRRKPLKNFTLDKNERLTPGARQFLIDHQIKIVHSEQLNERMDDINDLLKVDSFESKCKILFPLLELELWDAALKANEVNRSSCQRIMELVILTKKFAAGEVPDLPKTESKGCISLELTIDGLFQPNGKVILNLRRASVYSKMLKMCVSTLLQESLEELIYLIEKEISQLLSV